MPSSDALAPHDAAWRTQFAGLGRRLRLALGDGALRIDHIGATAVNGLPARPVIDVQLSVRALMPEAAYREPLTALGFVMEAGDADRMRRFFRETNTPSRFHLHVRAAGTLGEQAALLLRDYLRTDRAARVKVAKRKQQLEAEEVYTATKDALLWETLADAYQWAQQTGWTPGVSDA